MQQYQSHLHFFAVYFFLNDKWEKCFIFFDIFLLFYFVLVTLGDLDNLYNILLQYLCIAVYCKITTLILEDKNGRSLGLY